MSDRGARRWRLVRAAPAAIPQSVRRFNERARARRIASARPWLVSAGVAAVTGLAGWILFGSPLLGVGTVNVIGAGFVSTEAIRAAAAVPLGTPMIRVDTAAIERRVDRLAAVKTATVRRQWPTTLIVRVTLRSAIAAVPLGVRPTGATQAGSDSVARGYVLVDATGTPFRTLESKPDLPAILVDSSDLTDPATRAALDAGAKVLAALPAQLAAQLVRVVALSDTRVELILQANREIIWGDAANNQQKARVVLSLLQRPGHIIDVSAPTVVTVR